MTREETTNLLATVYANYQGQVKAPKSMLDLWCEAFASCDAAEVKRAVYEHMLDPEIGQYVPKIADITRHFARLRERQIATYNRDQYEQRVIEFSRTKYLEDAK